MVERGFAVPVARAEDGRWVLPDKAERGAAYRCPGCSAPVVLRRGTRKRPHFAHRGGDTCSPESALHRAAKGFVLQIISDWRAGAGPRPCIARPCPRYPCDGGVTQDLPEDITHAEEEVRLADGSVADVVLFRGSEPSAAIEILVTHEVGREKAQRLPLPWVEIQAEDLFDRPYWWVAVQDGLRPFTCPACSRRAGERAAEVEGLQDEAVALARERGIRLPPSPPYHYVVHQCWRCHESTIVFLWPGCGEHGNERPPDPIPRTVQSSVTEAWPEPYWANRCDRCSAVQGDHYLAGNRYYARVRECLPGLEDKGF